MDFINLKHIVQFVVISMAAAAVQLYLSPHAFTFGRYFFNALMALLAAYLVSSFCDFWQVPWLYWCWCILGPALV